MKIRFNRTIRLCIRLECYEDLWNTEQEWEFDKDEEVEVYDVIYGEPRKLRHGKKKKVIELADVFLLQGNDPYWDYIHDAPSDCFEIIE